MSQFKCGAICCIDQLIAVRCLTMMVFIVHAPTTMLFQTIVVHFDFTGLCRCQIRT